MRCFLSLATIRRDLKARFKRMIFMACLVSAAFLFIAAAPALSQNVPDTTQNFGLDSEFSNVSVQSDRDIKTIIALIVNIALGFLGIVAVIIILYAGYLWMTAAGNEEQVTKAKLVMRNAVIGLVIILMSWGIAAFLIDRLGAATGSTGNPTGGGAGSLFPGSGNVAAFRVDSFETSHNGDDASQDVQLCSSIQAQFNHWLNAEVFESLKDGDMLAIKRVSGGTYIDEGTIQIEKRNNVISFKRVDAQAVDADGEPTRVDWTPNASYEVRLPAELKDVRGRALSGCSSCGGERDGYYYWSFATGTTRDAVAPGVVSAYPSDGDTNVPRSVVFSFEFSESIDAASVISASGELDTAHVVLTAVDSEFVFPGNVFDASLSGSRLIFSLNQSHAAVYGDGPYLEPYTEYRLTIQNVADLCGNELVPPVEITFTTGADTPGVSFMRPSDGFGHACPATPVFLKFNTSMYNVRTQSCGVDGNGDAGLVLGGALTPSGVTLRSMPEDNFSGIGNPNDFCKTYHFNLDPGDSADDLIPGTSATSTVSYIEPGGDAANPEQETWSFDIAEAGECAQEPYINYVSGLRRNEGQWKQCVTIQGRYFGGSKGQSRSHTALSLDSPRNTTALTPAIENDWIGHEGLAIGDRAWSDTSVAGNFITQPGEALPEKDIVDFDVAVSVDSPVGVLTSNAVRFAVDTTQTFNGPCLYSINPVSGFWGDSVALSGSNLGDSAGGQLMFYDQKSQLGANASLWSPAIVRASVLDQSQNNPSDGEVHVMVNGISSNKLEFNLQAGIGQSCALDSGMCAPGLECNSSTLTCQAPDTFRITSVAPVSACTDSCANALISFETSKPIAEAGGNRVQIKKCPSGERCAWSDSRATLVAAQAALNGAQAAIITPQAAGGLLDLDSWYVVRVAGGPQGVVASDGKTLANLNADTDAVAGEDAYVWSFKTGSAACGVNRAELGQSAVAVYEGENAQLSARAYARANSCASGGQELVAPNNFSWKACEYIAGDIASECRLNCNAPLSGGSAIASVAASASSQSSVTGVTGSRDGSFRALACMFYDEEATHLKDGAIATVYAPCSTNADCTQNGMCAGSVCLESGANAGTCSPAITGFNPNSGTGGTWVTINGCYFGNTAGDVFIGSDPAAMPARANTPNAGWCGSTWSDSQIVAEVAPNAINPGPVRVVRPGFDVVSGGGVFTPNNTAHPSICRMSPASGRAQSIVDIKGKGFTRVLDGADAVVFTDSVGAAHSAISVVPGNIRSSCPKEGWSEEQVCMRVVDSAAAGAGTVSVSVSGVQSNAVAFTVLGAGLATPPGATRFSVVSYAPGQGAAACLNMIVEAVVSGEVMPDSVGFESGAAVSAGANFYVRRANDSALVAGTVRYTMQYGKTTFRLYPAAILAANTEYQIVLKGGTSGLQSESGGVLAGSELCDASPNGSADCIISFNTVSSTQENQCRISHVEVEPSDAIYTCAGDACAGDQARGIAGHQRAYEALAVNNAGQATVINTPVSWSSSDGAVLSETAASAISQTRFTVHPANGSTEISAAIAGTEFAGSTEARVFLCENPWPQSMLQDGIPWNDTAGGGFTTRDVHTNFSTFYCRDSGEPGADDDLPELEKRLEVGRGDDRDVAGLLKEVFFIQPDSTDAVGIRVLQNSENRSIREWYDAQDGLSGNPSSISALDSFPALQDGRTVYVAAPNDTLGQGATIYNNIYLISVNDNAAPETVSLFNQMVSNWRFLVNLPNQEEKRKFRDDMARIRDAHTMIRLFKNRQPSLDSGSFKRGLSLSVWPSWSQILSSDLGSPLPVDPVNKIYCEGEDIDQTTCWDPGAQQYVCNAEPGAKESHFYLYNYNAGEVRLQMNLAYGSPDAWNNVLEEPGAWNSDQRTACRDLEYRWTVPQ